MKAEEIVAFKRKFLEINMRLLILNSIKITINYYIFKLYKIDLLK